MVNKIIKTFVIEVHGDNIEDIEIGLNEAVNRMSDTDYEGTYSETDEKEDGAIRGFKYEIIEGKTNFIESIDLVLDS